MGGGRGDETDGNIDGRLRANGVAALRRCEVVKEDNVNENK